MRSKNTQNYLNGTWLHKYRETILQAVSELKTLRQIAELLAPFAESEQKRITPQIIHTYLKRHPPSENDAEKKIQAENIKPITTEKESIVSAVAKQAADDVFSPVEQNRVVTKPDLVTPPKQQNSKPDNVKKSGRLSDRLKERNVGKFEPDSNPENSEYL